MSTIRLSLTLSIALVAAAACGDRAEAACRYTKAQQNALYRQYLAFKSAGQQNYNYWVQYQVGSYLQAARLSARGANNIAARLRACGRRVANVPPNGNSGSGGGGGGGDDSDDRPTYKRVVYFVYYQTWTPTGWTNWMLDETYCCLSDAIDRVNVLRGAGFMSEFTQQSGTWKQGDPSGWNCGVNGFMIARQGNGGSWTCTNWIDWENFGTGIQ